MKNSTPEKDFGEKFHVIILGVIFDPKTRKILIGKRKEKDPHIPELTWIFPGGKISRKAQEDLEEVLERKIKIETNLDVKNLGAIFSRIPPEKKDLLIIYYLCEVVGGEENPFEKEGDLSELKWVSPEELENYFTTSFHPRLKEYIINLK